MIVDEFECDLFRAGYINVPTQSADTENETTLHEMETNWQVLFPEVVQEAPTTTTHTTSVNNFENQVENDDDDVHHNKQHSSSSSEDLIVIDHKLIGEQQPSTSNSNNVPLTADEDFNISVHTISETMSSSSSTSSRLSEQDDIDKDSTQMREPPIQVMRKDDDDANYDPQRIPFTVFDRSDSVIPAEWSATSNESLFSLHIGNASIGKDDQAFLLSGELKKNNNNNNNNNNNGALLLPTKSRGELTIGELQEMTKLASLSKPGEHQLVIPEIFDDQNNDEPITSSSSSSSLDKNSLGENEEDSHQKIITTIQVEEEKKHKNESIHSSSISLQSNTSEDSNYSFAFPVFGEAEKNALAKGFPRQQNTKKQDVKSPSVALQQVVVPSSSHSKGFFSYFKKFSCCACFSCSSCVSCNYCCRCTSCLSFTSCPSCPSSCSHISCPSCPSCFSCVSFPSCPSCCKTCCY